MRADEMTLAAGPKGPNRKRIGRGIGSHGKTSGRGHKGAGSRSGNKRRLGAEGGQMPLFRRIAKRGFSAGDYSAQKRIAIVNIGSFEKLDSQISVINEEVLAAAGLIPRRTRTVRVLGSGDLKRALTVEAQYASRSALEKIEAAGGKFVTKD